MCGIVGIVSRESVAPILLQGLRNLEYRGYDSAGISVLSETGIELVKRSGRVRDIEDQAASLSGRIGIGHTRWATHGDASNRNAHPHTSSRIALVHNGVIENHETLRRELSHVSWRSETDTEVALQFLESRLVEEDTDLFRALLALANGLEGRSSFVLLSANEPDTLYAIRYGAPLVIGRSNGEVMIASDPVAFQNRCQEVCFVPDESVIRLRRDEVLILDLKGKPRSCLWTSSAGECESQEVGDHAHFMHKELFEQPRVIDTLLRNYLNEDGTALRDSIGVSGLNFGKVSHIRIVGCGSAYHAGLLARSYLEANTRLPITVEHASEARYSEQPQTAKTLLIALSQSGETADTLACVEEARRKGCQVLAFCNRENSTLTRLATKSISLHCGPEVSVAATKSFTAMVVCLHLFSLGCGVNRGLLSKDGLKSKLADVRGLKDAIETVLGKEPELAAIARKYSQASSALFIGRRWSYPVALEAALKLKEISYIHAEGVAGGELKHGTLALVDPRTPTFAFAPRDAQFAKVLSNIRTIVSRGGPVVGFGDPELKDQCEDFIELPSLSDSLNPVPGAVAAQLLSYHVALFRGVDIDRPRNLAKSVTVE